VPIEQFDRNIVARDLPRAQLDPGTGKAWIRSDAKAAR